MVWSKQSSCTEEAHARLGWQQLTRNFPWCFLWHSEVACELQLEIRIVRASDVSGMLVQMLVSIGQHTLPTIQQTHTRVPTSDPFLVSIIIRLFTGRRMAFYRNSPTVSRSLSFLNLSKCCSLRGSTILHWSTCGVS